MLWPSLEKWSSSHGRVFNLWRYYYQGKWTPFCRVKLRYFTTGEPPRGFQSSEPPPPPIEERSC